MLYAFGCYCLKWGFCAVQCSPVDSQCVLFVLYVYAPFSLQSCANCKFLVRESKEIFKKKNKKYKNKKKA